MESENMDGSSPAEDLSFSATENFIPEIVKNSINIFNENVNNNKIDKNTEDNINSFSINIINNLHVNTLDHVALENSIKIDGMNSKKANSHLYDNSFQLENNILKFNNNLTIEANILNDLRISASRICLQNEDNKYNTINRLSFINNKKTTFDIAHKKVAAFGLELNTISHFDPCGEISSFHHIECPLCNVKCLYINIRAHLRAHCNYFPYSCGYCFSVGPDLIPMQNHCTNIHSEVKIISNLPNKNVIKTYKRILLKISNIISLLHNFLSKDITETNLVKSNLIHSNINKLSENNIIENYSLINKIKNLAKYLSCQKNYSELCNFSSFSQKNYICSFCRFVSYSVISIQKHLVIQHNYRIKQKIEKMSNSSFTNYFELLSSIVFFQNCGICKKKVSANHFIIHIRQHSDYLKTYIHCFYCTFHCTESVTIIFHLRHCHPEKEMLVLYNPVDGGDLEPLRVHELSKIYFIKRCPLCNKEIKSRFVQHHLSFDHGRKSLYKCIYCSFKSIMKSLIILHIKKSHKGLTNLYSRNSKKPELHKIIKTESRMFIKPEIKQSIKRKILLKTESAKKFKNKHELDIDSNNSEFYFWHNKSELSKDNFPQNVETEQHQIFCDVDLSESSDGDQLSESVFVNYRQQFKDVLSSQRAEAILRNQIIFQNEEDFDPEKLIFIASNICALCGKRTIRNIHYHARSHFRNPMYKCNYCNYRQKSRHSVYVHQASKHNDNTSNIWEVEFANAKKSESNLDKYLRWYFSKCLQNKDNDNSVGALGNEVNSLAVPDNSYKNEETLNSKMNFIVYLRKYSIYYICSLCNEKLSSANSFNFHKHDHTEMIVEYFCSKCSFTTTVKSNANIHAKSHIYGTHIKKVFYVKYLSYLSSGIYHFLTISVPQLNEKLNIVPYICLKDCTKNQNMK